MVNEKLKEILIINGYKVYVERNDIAGINDACKRILENLRVLMRDLDPNDSDDRREIDLYNKRIQIIGVYLEGL